ncbi:MAG: hypothetical protein COA81_13290, partial [Alphaproteobacteria bacterium]
RFRESPSATADRLLIICLFMTEGYRSKDIGHCKESWQLFCEKLEQHFDSEEKIMASFNYVKEEHNNCHQKILGQTLAVGRDCETLEDWRGCLYQIRDEILSQILRHDLHFAEHLIGIGYNEH